MSWATATAWVALVAMLVPVFQPRAVAWWAAAAAALVAMTVRQVHLDPASVPLMVAAAAAMRVAVRPTQGVDRGVALIGALLVGAALLAPPSPATLAIGPAVLAAGAGTVAALTLAAALQRAMWVGYVLAVLPFPAAAVAPAHTDLAVALPGGVGRWAAQGGLEFAASTWPAWADLAWQWGPWLLLTYALIVSARPGAWRLGGGVVALVLAAAAGAQIAAVVAAIGAGAVQVGLGDVSGSPAPTRTAAALSGLGGGLVLARVAALVLWARWRASRQDEIRSPVGAGLATAAALGSALLLALTAALAPAWFGPTWASDPGVAALLFGLIVSATLAMRWLDRRLDAPLHGALALAAALLLGGGLWGWRVAGVVFGS